MPLLKEKTAALLLSSALTALNLLPARLLAAPAPPVADVSPKKSIRLIPAIAYAQANILSGRNLLQALLLSIASAPGLDGDFVGLHTRDGKDFMRGIAVSESDPRHLAFEVKAFQTLPDTLKDYNPTMVITPEDARKIVGDHGVKLAYSFTFGSVVVLAKDGTVWDSSIYRPGHALGAQVSGIPGKVTDIAAGFGYGGAVNDKGDVYVWGVGNADTLSRNAHERCDKVFCLKGLDFMAADGTKQERNSPGVTYEPHKVAGLHHIVQIALGYRIGAALDKDGAVWAWTHYHPPVKIWEGMPKSGSEIASCVANAVHWRVGGTPQQRLDGVSHLLAALQTADVTNIQEQAYVLATADLETDGFKSLTENITPEKAEEKYQDNPYLGNTQPGDGYRFRGRGYIHVTGRGHYEKFGGDFDIGNAFLNNPDLMTNPDYAARAAAEGMRDGVITGVGFDRFYDKNDNFNYEKARSIINADKDDYQKGDTLKIGERIAATARQVENAIKTCSGGH